MLRKILRVSFPISEGCWFRGGSVFVLVPQHRAASFHLAAGGGSALWAGCCVGPFHCRGQVRSMILNVIRLVCKDPARLAVPAAEMHPAGTMTSCRGAQNEEHGRSGNLPQGTGDVTDLAGLERRTPCLQEHPCGICQFCYQCRYFFIERRADGVRQCDTIPIFPPSRIYYEISY
jgi:hypothetical protein